MKRELPPPLRRARCAQDGNVNKHGGRRQKNATKRRFGGLKCGKTG